MADRIGYKPNENAEGLDIPHLYVDQLDGTFAEKVVVGTSALPAGAATAANQTTEIASLANLNNIGAGEYETVAANQTAQVLGTTGAIGDYLAGLLIVPATTSPGNVLILDNAISITIFIGGATSVADLKPIYVPLGMKSVSGAWKVTTGANVSVIGIGNFV